jgi:heme/copper-type cytochrome/quinol oxidase subunit 2
MRWLWVCTAIAVIMGMVLSIHLASGISPNNKMSVSPVALPQPQADNQTITAAKPDPLLINYTNTQYGYSIDYPQGWHVNTENIKYNTIKIYNTPPQDGIIAVGSAEGSLRSQVDAYRAAIKQVSSNSILLVDKQETSKWNWHLSFQGTEQENGTDVTIRREIFFMQAGDTTYTLAIVILAAAYDSYPFKQVVDSFRLIPVKGN